MKRIPGTSITHLIKIKQSNLQGLRAYLIEEEEINKFK